mmetsp:Transcript_18086/g.30977  ORF Transcript_18086/g.30977 Transcript_18086/m.30977 type:complete len:99 (-) Transcript_18086:559-855(-)|eukprot:CAMPEP_0119104566 /NCGR_PEP_ID=MMETSP1180-20130426/2757_1 /TAXON_ID=3052 ORGANISM="Chlamydomonas cf sp, Strain CCMP681" /NCGR_SAMPLE_ID=MMETSP1180 /ASSEMBLY_ACC=CAM_ASM_000741 /LENGTH=98 /DNA_ID=CAMNT_0007089373 /DNA_START=225 /DNA_END=521 /DNA_ORIENTATION=-
MSQQGPPQLVQICIETLSLHMDVAVEEGQVAGLPEDIALTLFQMVLKRGKLTPAILKHFKDSDHSSLLELIQSMDLRDPPPIYRDTRNRALGDKPNLY